MERAPNWLHRDFILGYFGDKVSVAQLGYKEFVSLLVAQKYESPQKRRGQVSTFDKMQLIGYVRHRPNVYHQMIRKWNMARPLRIAFPGAFYHVTARGNERKAVFKSIRDRQKFLEYLETATERYNAVIHAYCLMDNHYHILLETPSGNLPVSYTHLTLPTILLV